ncbi:hypothetical protein OH810_32060 [Streptomyces albidoflavus]|uniref:hypothetical protein n=1 Tax=Streptomyces albidoflavus TaxID=1886 RepID=UPI003C2F0B0B|nr:hypothetical protein OH810_32060 [Streptomyces albidoflavus]
MSTTPDHPAAARQISTEDLLQALLPDTPAGAAPTRTAPAAEPVLDVAQLLELARAQGALDASRAAVPAPSAAVVPATPTNSGPIVPRWAIGTAVASVGLGAGSLLLGYALDLLATGAAAVAAGISAAAPMLLIGAVLVAALLGRRRASGGVQVTQSMTQTVTIRGRR